MEFSKNKLHVFNHVHDSYIKGILPNKRILII